MNAFERKVICSKRNLIWTCRCEASRPVLEMKGTHRNIHTHWSIGSAISPRSCPNLTRTLFADAS